MSTSVIISYYKITQNLKVILTALTIQTVKNFEVIISEDDDHPETRLLLNEFSEKLKITHVCQEDCGFRKNAILNKSIQKANSNFLIFIDGDCVPDKNFVFQYQKYIKKKTFLLGRRVMLSERISNKVLNSKGIYNFRFLKLLFSKSRKVEDAFYFPFLKQKKSKRGLCGCNWGVNRSDILNINGFDEDYLNPGVGEDVDIEWRLSASGIMQQSIRNKAIVYHLFHKRGYSDEKVLANYRILERKKKDNNIYCKNGIKKD